MEEQKEPIKSPLKLLPRVLPPNPLLSGLPAYLKNPKNYEKVYKAIYNAGVSSCDHSEVLEWAGCSKCQARQRDRLLMMRKLGFTSGKQYLAWDRVHQQIRSNLKAPLEKYDE